MDLDAFLKSVSVFTIPVLFAVTMHEVAHGWAAKLLGDRTAELLGRLSLNPFKHLDLVGSVVVPGVLLALHAPLFGWARPVPVATGALKNPRTATLAVAAAGPLANLLMALICCLILIGALHLPQGLSGPRWITLMAQAGIFANVYLAYLNLLPIPPLDGGRVLISLLPQRLAAAVQKVEPVGLMLVMLLALAASQQQTSQQLGLGVIFKPAHIAESFLINVAMLAAEKK